VRDLKTKREELTRKRKKPRRSGVAGEESSISFVRALWLVPEHLTEASLSAAPYSCSAQVVPDQLWLSCSL
jgi:hypothetical protein